MSIDERKTLNCNVEKSLDSAPSDLFIDWLCDSQFQFTRSVPFVYCTLLQRWWWCLAVLSTGCTGSDRQSSGYAVYCPPNPTPLHSLLCCSPTDCIAQSTSPSKTVAAAFCLCRSRCAAVLHILVSFFTT